ncbi:hypothetical protein [Pseudoalteromonas shioyasakiensis]|uniref:hypothetical protein n=1 Tax=Pseudoalteromonas shioyasakiensis TaxID=1190813 RepID=UPI001C3DB8A7|nr:hypothetical protein [Pseudoalteromonas shioyasakiensis]
MRIVKHKTYAFDDKKVDKEGVSETPDYIIHNNDKVYSSKFLPQSLTVYFNAFLQMTKTVWFKKLKSENQSKYLNSIVKFLDWAQLHTSSQSLEILNNFDKFEIEQNKKKPQSSIARVIQTTLTKVRANAYLNAKDRLQIKRVLDNTKLARDLPNDSKHLGLWFTSHQWLQKKLGKTYYKLASPKALHSSFHIVIAQSLLTLCKARKELNGNDKHRLYYERSSAKATSSREQQHLISELLKETHQSAMQPVHQVVWTECIKPLFENEIHDAVNKNGACELTNALKGKNTDYPYRRPSVLCGEAPSIVEQTLCYWLLCGLAIQPTDAAKMKKKDLIFNKSNAGLTRFFQVKYFKGRAKIKYESPLLLGGDLVVQAIESYLDLLPDNQKRLFTDKVTAAFSFSNPYQKSRKSHPFSVGYFLIKLWNADWFKKEVAVKNVGDSLFLDVLNTLIRSKGITFEEWKSKSKKNTDYEQYLLNCSNTLPEKLFSGTHIKNTSVYSRSDRYREGDLVNDNSHTSLTEKLSYMTDQNKDWVNQVGRITRLVLDDIENHALSPCRQFIDNEVYEKVLKTRVSQATSSQKARVNNLNMHVESTESSEDFVVIESTDNAVSMLHYIEQAELNYVRLSNNNPEFVENTLIINVEWMFHCLSQFSPKTLKSANKLFNEIKDVLPKLFLNESAGNISI